MNRGGRMFAMDLFSGLSLKRKLIFIYIISIIAILLLIGTIIIVNEVFSGKRALVSESTGTMRTIGKNSVSALLFNDKKDAEDTLKVLGVFPDVLYAATMDRNGNVHAEYRRDKDYEVRKQTFRLLDGHRFGLREAEFFQNIILHNENVGAVYLVRDLKRFYVKLYQSVAVLLLAILVSLLIGYFFSLYLQKIVTDPINDLLKMMKVISEKKQYSLRADAATRDEIGDLAQGFNEMLLKIEERDAELNSHRQHLEELVQKRTEELVIVNRHLTHELEEREKFERALRESENRYRTIFENTGTASIIIEEDMIISLANAEFAKLSGYGLEELIDKMSWTEFVHPRFLERMKEYHILRRMGSDRAPNNYETQFIDKFGGIKDVNLTVEMIPGTQKSIASILDITERKELEEQLLQSQKMEAVGQLAGGVAHDFNNLLTAIIGYGGILKMQLDDNSPMRAYVESILHAGERAAALTQGLLAFSRKQVIAPKHINLNDAIKNMEKLLFRVIGEDIELRTLFKEPEIFVLADAGQIGQVLMNLATNARDAMPDGGILEIETSIVSVDKDFVDIHKYQKPGPCALLRVSDVGQGMSKELTERVFEPFFTTKEVGKGTGLGLSIAYGIIQQHSGHIQVSSELHQGTSFEIYLPLSKPINEETRTESPVKAVSNTTGTGTILVVEDDEAVRRLITMILKDYGYHVIEAGNGEEALELFRTNKETIDLLLLDVVLPKMNGKIVFDGAETIKPGIQAIFMSGYTADIIHKKGLFEEGINFIQKPIVHGDLIKMIRQLLNK